MSYFPFFADIENADVLVVGGGRVALRKVERLLPYGPRITVAACSFCPELLGMDEIVRVKAAFAQEMVEGRDAVIAATDDAQVNERIYALCKLRRIPVNVVDDKEKCSFLFPSLVKRGALSIGISTGGASPSAAVYLKERIEEILPERIGEILAFLEMARPMIRQSFRSESERTARNKELFLRCLAAGGPLTEEELRTFCGESADGK